ncbi:hypothetical protein MKX01_021807 [Papaver californicum]|nr:hypothetical protein MKX01_021807 [Papaver californicum]
MDAGQMQRRLIDYAATLFQEFTQLQQLQDVSNPDFVFELAIDLFFFGYRSQQCADFKKIDAHVHQLKGSSSSSSMLYLVWHLVAMSMALLDFPRLLSWLNVDSLMLSFPSWVLKSSGKNTLLNHLFQTNFREIDAFRGRGIKVLFHPQVSNH